MTPAVWVRALWRLLRAVAHGLHGLALVLLRFPRLERPERQARIRWWATKMLRVLGLRLEQQGQWSEGARLIVANHISWLDVMALHATCPQARFVSKADVQHWPLVNRLVAGADTLYIRREHRRDALRVLHTMTDALRGGDTVAVFPEGTTGDGERLLPFHGNLIQAAIAAQVPVQPVALRFSDRHHPASRAARFVGDTSLAQSLWMLAQGEGLTVHVHILPTLQPQPPRPADAGPDNGSDRRVLAQQAREVVAAALAPALGHDPR